VLDQVAFELGEYRGTFRTPVSMMVEFVRMGVKAPVHRTLGIAKSKTMITDVVHIAAGTPETKRLVATAPMNLSMVRVRDCPSRWIRVAKVRSVVTVYTLRQASTAETIETTICAVARLFETKASKGPVERLSMRVPTNK
jgi:hypothetical protein